ncbi:hypothetical protein MLD38_015797 [Melastoma candidum]|uniref:Uncharacterized protein n=1 Tax=Melastoma candidum TaxID=119954 RepID=A0ACB9RIN6_9MYRT|nr:hypothetical protein MLD38_015797 [Melastoma candidum]
MNTRSMGDLFPEPNSFDPALNLEETHVKEGYKDGYSDGLVTGREEGRSVGLKDGFEKGEELGFYRGCLDVWNSAIRVDPLHFSTRVQKSVKAMESLLRTYPVMDPENKQIQDILNDLRLKFRAICAIIGVKLEYEGYPGAGGRDTRDFSF